MSPKPIFDFDRNNNKRRNPTQFFHRYCLYYMYITYQNHIGPYRVDWRCIGASKAQESSEYQKFDEIFEILKKLKKSKKIEKFEKFFFVQKR